MRAKLAATLPDVAVLDGTAEAIPLRDHDVHAVVVGEAFHWFEPAAATKEIARVLTDGGGIALLWNSPTWTLDDTPWLADFRRIVARYRQAAGGYPAGDGTWRVAFERTRRFEALEQCPGGPRTGTRSNRLRRASRVVELDREPRQRPAAGHPG